MAKHSTSSKDLFSTTYNVAIISYNATRWWSWWEVVSFLELHFDNIPAFVRTLKSKNWSKASTEKMLEIINIPSQANNPFPGLKRFQMEVQLHVCKIAGEPFVKTGYLLETKGFVAPFVYELIVELKSHVDCWNLGGVLHSELKDWFERKRRLWESHPYTFLQTEEPEKTLSTAISSVRAMHTYFMEKFWEERGALRSVVSLFKTVRIFCPFFLNNLVESGEFDEQDGLYKCLSPLKKIKGISTLLLQEMAKEYPVLKLHLEELCQNNEKKDSLKENAEFAWKFWCKLHQTGKIDAWWQAVQHVAILHPCSTAMEGVFSVAKGNVKANQNQMRPAKQEISAILASNGQDLY